MDTMANGAARAASTGSDRAAVSRPGGLLFIFLTVFLDLLGMTILIPVTVYIIQQYNSSATVVGLLSVTYAAAQFLAAPLLGQLSDRYGRRPLLLLSVFGSACGYLLFGIGGALWVLFLARLVDGITAGNLSVAQAYIADISRPEEQTKNFAVIGVAYGLGFILGPAFGGALGQVNIRLPAFAAAGLSLASVAVGYFTLGESLPVEKRRPGPLSWSQSNPFSAMAQVGRMPGMSSLLGTMFLFNFAFNGMTSNLGVFARMQFGIQPAELAMLMVAGGVANLLVQGGLSQKGFEALPPRRLVLAGLALHGVAYLSTGLAPAFWMLYPLYGLLCVGNALVFPALTALLAAAAPVDEQGKVTGVNASLCGLTSVLGPLWTGLLYDYFLPAAPYVSFGCLVCAAAVSFNRDRK